MNRVFKNKQIWLGLFLAFLMISLAVIVAFYIFGTKGSNLISPANVIISSNSSSFKQSSSLIKITQSSSESSSSQMVSQASLQVLSSSLQSAPQLITASQPATPVNTQTLPQKIQEPVKIEATPSPVIDITNNIILDSGQQPNNGDDGAQKIIPG